MSLSDMNAKLGGMRVLHIISIITWAHSGVVSATEESLRWHSCYSLPFTYLTKKYYHHQIFWNKMADVNKTRGIYGCTYFLGSRYWLVKTLSTDFHTRLSQVIYYLQIDVNARYQGSRWLNMRSDTNTLFSAQSVSGSACMADRMKGN